MVEVRMTLEEFNALRAAAGFAPIMGAPGQVVPQSIELNTPVGALPEPAKPKRRKTAYQRRYKAAFKRIAKKHKLKSGKWKAGGFKRAVREAHKIAGGKRR